jgi:hypothetical protein
MVGIRRSTANVLPSHGNKHERWNQHRKGKEQKIKRQYEKSWLCTAWYKGETNREKVE